MNKKRYLAYRLAWAGVASFGMTVVLFFIALHVGDFTDAPRVQESLPDTSEEFWTEGDPVYVQYGDWLYSLVTFDWGTSQRFGEPVTSLLVERGKVTAAYLVPAVFLGTLFATVFGYVAGRNRGQKSDGAIRLFSYVLLAIPNFVVAGAFAKYIQRRMFELDASTFQLEASLLSEWNLIWLSVGAGLMGTHIAAVQIRHVRSQSSKYLEMDFSRQLRAKGVGPRRTARHILRAAAVPLTALFVAEVLGLLLVSVFVIEAALGIPGLGYIAWQAAGVNDAQLLLTITFLLAVTVILFSVLEDIVSVVLDPRLETVE